jgi:hypothetical protein
MYAFLISSVCVTSHVYSIHLDFILLITHGDQYRLETSSLRSFLKFPVTFRRPGPSIVLSKPTLF